MIEDLQDERQKEEPKRRTRSMKKGSILLLAFFIWIIYSAVLVMSFLPKIQDAVQKSGIKTIMQNIDILSRNANTRTVGLCFAIPHADGSASFVICNQKVKKTGYSIYHDAIEGLLSGPGKDALGRGAITFIEENTRLIGLTVSNGTAFVNLSESFIVSGSSWDAKGLDTAITQITRTLEALDPGIKKVVLLVEGTEISC